MKEISELLSDYMKDALGSLFFGIYRVNLITGEVEPVRLSDDVKGLVDSAKNNSDDFIKLVGEVFYHVHSQTELLDSFSIENLKKCKADGVNKVERELVRMYKGSYHRVSLVALLSDKEDDTLIVLQDVDEEYKAREEHTNMIQSLSSVYYTMYSIDCEKDMITAIDAKMDSDIMLTNHGRFSHIMRIYGNNCIFYEDQENFFKFMSISHFMKNLSFENPFLEMEYRRIYDYGIEWIRAEIILVNEVNGKPGRVLLATRNITSQKNKENVYKQAVMAASDLEGAEVNTKNLAAQSYYKKTDFIKKLSNLLTYPINSYLGLVNAAELNVNDPKTLLLYTNELKKLGGEMLHITRELSDIGEIEKGQMNFIYEPVPIYDYLVSLMEDYKEMAEERNHQFLVSGLEFTSNLLMVDRVRLKQVLDSVVDNAVRYTKDGGKIYIEVDEKKTASPDKFILEIVVRDTGFGMSASFLEHIYEPFFPIPDPRVADEQGMGLAMGIAKSLVEGMKGDINIQSIVDQGTVVTINIPCEGVKANAEVINESSDEEIKPLTLPVYTSLESKRVLFYGPQKCKELLELSNIIVDEVKWFEDINPWFERSRLDDYQMIIVDITEANDEDLCLADVIHTSDREDGEDMPVLGILDPAKRAAKYGEDHASDAFLGELETRGYAEIIVPPYDMESFIAPVSWWIK